MKKVYLFLVVLLTATRLLAQTSNLDEFPLPVLKQKLAASKNDTTRVKLQLAQGHLILFKSGGGQKEIDSALSFANQAVKLSRQLNYNDGIFNAMLLSAESFNKKPDPERGFKIAQQALAFSKKVNNMDGIAKSYLIIGQHYQVSDPMGLRTRMDYNNKAIAIFRKERSLRWLANTLTTNAELLFLAGQRTDAIKLLFEILNIGDAVSRRTVEGIYWLIGRTSTELSDYPNALKYNLLAIKTAKEVQDTTLLLCSIYHTMAVTYVKIQDYNRALPYSLNALKIARHYHNKDYIATVAITLATEYTRTNRLAQALALLEEVKSYSDTDPDKLSVAAVFLNNLTYAKQFKKAVPYVQEVKELLAKVPKHNFEEVMGGYNSLSYYYVETSQSELASFYSDLYAEIVHKMNFQGGIKTAESRYFKLDSMKGNFKSAIDHYLVAQRIKDSIDNVTKAYQISLLQIENETEKKNSDIEALTKQSQVKDDQLKRNHFIQRLIIAGSAVLLIITGLIYSRYRLKQRSTALLMLQKAEIDQQNISLQHLVYDKNQLIGEKDELLYEKDLLLKEVNHRVKNNLQIVMSLLASQSGYMQNKKAQEAILESQNRVQAIALIHDTLYNTDKIAEIALASYITDLIQSLDDSINKGKHKVVINCDVDDILLDVSQAIPLGIILNESVTNALKYAFPGDRTGEIMVSVKQVGKQIEMSVRDNGIGLPAGFNLFKADSLGVTLIKGLTDQLKGTFDIHYRIGVTIMIKFPIEIAARTGTSDSLMTEVA
ncbi:hypothetical protein GCM10023149_01600 [Mucilaginibacter gynuensis]|uniref:histidine kinase n=1 Tax=Mucilaginibacter gynuensis TaxID=1302236 RepID=A0ABP8FNU1_9SPHI